ncbi:NAD(P)-dependent oxidoreductase [Candidatus Parcubacteria bacterium]|nr:MAG: NAD(P)-dependent oxidoreductase [Candidatus Parcubacteria bacterium]
MINLHKKLDSAGLAHRIQAGKMGRFFVFGAAGFIGQHLIREVDSDMISPVTRRLKKRIPADHKDRTWLVADLLNPHSIEQILTPGSIVINLAYSGSSSSEDNITMVENLVQACRRAHVSKLVHCSTAVVVGENPSPTVSEDTKCLPVTPYEKTKYQIESLLLDAANDDLKIYILRPTAVIGPGGQNLKKLLWATKAGNSVMNYIRSSLFGNRNLNLVAVKDVVGALMHLSKLSSFHSGVYICSADDDPDNRYDKVEAIMRELLEKQKRIKPTPLPKQILKLILRVSRSGAGRFANRNYSSEKLFHTGFQRSESVAQAVREFVLSEVASSMRGSL